MRDAELLLEEFRGDLIEFAIRLRSGLEVVRGGKGSSAYTIEDPKSGAAARVYKSGRTRAVNVITPGVPLGGTTSNRGNRVLLALAKHFRDSARKGRPKEIYSEVVNPKLMHKLRKMLPREINHTYLGKEGRLHARVQKKLGRSATPQEVRQMWDSYFKEAPEPQMRRQRQIQWARQRIIEAKARQKRG